MSRLRCKSENHPRIAHDGLDAIVTRCVRCRKPTCSDCEGSDNGFRDICDTCWVALHNRITVARAARHFGRARQIVRKWAARGRFREVLRDYDLDIPETGYRRAS